MSDSDSDGPPDLEDMGDMDGFGEDDIPPLEDVGALEAAESKGSDAAEDEAGMATTDSVVAPPVADGEEPTLMDAMLAASAAAQAERQAKLAAERKKEDATFGSGLSAKAMFSAPVVVEDGSDSDEDGAASSAVGSSGGAGAGVGAGGAADSGAGAASDKARKKVAKRPRHPKQEAKLLSAAAKGNLDGVRAAVALKLNLNCQAKNKAGQTPLALASHGGFMPVVNCLLEAGADPDAVTKTGKTPLIVATRAGQEEVVLALLAARARKAIKDSKGKTAMQYAKAKRRRYIIELLERHEDPEDEEDIEEVIITPGAAKRSGLLLPEVQKAMADSVPSMERTLKDGNWMTPEFMKKLAANPLVARGLSNPNFMAAIGEFQSNPAKAKKKYANEPAMQEFMKAFFGLMGEHFTELGKKQEEEQKRQAEEAAAKAAADAEAARKAALDSADDDVKAALSDTNIMDILSDPGVKHAMQDAQRPGRLRYWLNDATIGPKLRYLQKAGLVQFQV